jgi:hypothetical protein
MATRPTRGTRRAMIHDNGSEILRDKLRSVSIDEVPFYTYGIIIVGAIRAGARPAPTVAQINRAGARPAPTVA